jgi:hypothetical protein
MRKSDLGSWTQERPFAGPSLKTCEMIQDRNEAKVIQYIARLIVPSAQSLASRQFLPCFLCCRQSHDDLLCELECSRDAQFSFPSSDSQAADTIDAVEAMCMVARGDLRAPLLLSW